MTVAPTDFKEAHVRVWALIEFGLESNSNWRQMFVDYGLLATVGFDQPFDKDDDKVRELAEQLDLSADVVVAELCYFIRQNCLWNTDELVAEMDRALSVLVEQGSPAQVVESLLDFSPYAKRPAVLRALRSSAAKRDDAEAFQSAFSRCKQ